MNIFIDTVYLKIYFMGLCGIIVLLCKYIFIYAYPCFYVLILVRNDKIQMIIQLIGSLRTPIYPKN